MCMLMFVLLLLLTTFEMSQSLKIKQIEVPLPDELCSPFLTLTLAAFCRIQSPRDAKNGKS